MLRKRGLCPQIKATSFGRGCLLIGMVGVMRAETIASGLIIAFMDLTAFELLLAEILKCKFFFNTFALQIYFFLKALNL